MNAKQYLIAAIILWLVACCACLAMAKCAVYSTDCGMEFGAKEYEELEKG